jgi:sugar/nucleoside kinase (ribokinase family)
MSSPPPLGKTFDVVGFGFNTLDHVCVVPRPPAPESKQRLCDYVRQPGGQVPTALVALQRWGLRTAYVGPFGNDEGGDLQWTSLTHEGIDLRGSRRRADVGSQVSFIFVDQVSGERTILWERPDGLALQANELERKHLTAGRVLFMDADDVDTALHAARWARADGTLVMLDVDEPAGRTEELLAYTNLAIVSGNFPKRLTGETDLRRALKKMGRMGPNFLVATLGSGGAVACVEGEVLHVPALPVAVVDTTSAGDLFHAGCLYGLLHAWKPKKTLFFAAAAAGLECTALGGRRAIPSIERVSEVLKAQPHRRDPRAASW